jgi:predicted ATPase
LIEKVRCLTKRNFYIITGGPGGGKTSLLESLTSKGYNYVPESARQIIKERLSKGLSPRPDPKTFAREIFDQDWKNFISNSDVSSLLFFDRSFMDSACMLFDSDMDSYDKIRDTYLASRYNNKVFITPPWQEIYRNDAERDQSFKQSIEVYHRLEKWYTQHDYDILVLTKETIETRVKFILDQVAN